MFSSNTLSNTLATLPSTHGSANTASLSLEKTETPSACSLANTKSLFMSASSNTQLSNGAFSFLRLPKELRDKIYPHLLAADHVERRFHNPAYSPLPPDMIRNRNNHPGPVEVGGLRSQDYCTHTFEYDLAITRAYHQIHAEALEVFERENHWVRVQTNKAGFGRALKDRGYGVVCGQEPKNPQTEDLIHDDCELA